MAERNDIISRRAVIDLGGLIAERDATVRHAVDPDELAALPPSRWPT